MTRPAFRRRGRGDEVPPLLSRDPQNVIDFWPQNAPGRTEMGRAVRMAEMAHKRGRIVGGVFLLRHDIWRWVPIKNVAARGGVYAPDPVMVRGVLDMCAREGWTIGAIFHNEWSKVRSRVGSTRRWERFTPLELHWLPALTRRVADVVIGRKTSSGLMRRETRELWRVRV